MNRICLVLFDTNNRISGPLWAAIHRILILVMLVNSLPQCGLEAALSAKPRAQSHGKTPKKLPSLATEPRVRMSAPEGEATQQQEVNHQPEAPKVRLLATVAPHHLATTQAQAARDWRGAWQDSVCLPGRILSVCQIGIGAERGRILSA
jgi:hypothetical protein